VPSGELALRNLCALRDTSMKLDKLSGSVPTEPTEIQRLDALMSGGKACYIR